MINTAKYILEMLNKDSKGELEKRKEGNTLNNEQVYFDFVLEKLDIEKLK